MWKNLGLHIDYAASTDFHTYESVITSGSISTLAHSSPQEILLLYSISMIWVSFEVEFHTLQSDAFWDSKSAPVGIQSWAREEATAP